MEIDWAEAFAIVGVAWACCWVLVRMVSPER